MTISQTKIAIVIPRFFPEIAGGAEKLALDYVNILKNHYKVEVFTTCAKDYITWKNELKEGSELWNGVTIHRYKVKKPRNLKVMNRVLDSCLKKGTSVTESEEENFLIEQGPFCPELVSAFLRAQYDFGLAILVGYLYYPIVKLLPHIKIRKLIIPTFHEEPALSLPIYAKTFLPTYTYSFNAPEELNVYQNRFSKTPNHTLIGTYVDSLALDNKTRSESSKVSIDGPKIILLTLGRMEAAKGFAELFQYFDRWQKTYDQQNIEWISIGSNHLDAKEIPNCITLKGYVSEFEKQRLISTASLVINPSPYESFSIAMMEAWSFGIPVLVNGKSEVMRGHNLRSQGGLHYSDETSFRRCLEYLIERPLLRKRLGENGKKYVLANFTKEVVSKKLLTVISTLLG
jgi:glycosyltransferase involved in cell wall biosynthesis